MLRKVWTTLIAIGILAGVIAGCGAKQDQPAGDSAANNQANQTNQAEQSGQSGTKDGVAGQQTAYPVTIKDDAGRDVTFTAEPKRIISVAPSNTELVFALGKGGSLVGRSDWDDYPAEAQSVASIGSILPQPNYEKIISLQPDLILLIGGGDDVRKKLTEEYKINTFVVQPTDFNGVYASIKNLGIILNVQPKANELVAEMEQAVRAVSEKVAGATSKPKVFFAIADDSGLWTTGSGTFQDTLIGLAGGTNVAASVSGWANYSLEQLVAADPDVIIANSKDGAEKIKGLQGWENLKAVKSGKVYGVPDINLIERPGPRLVQGLQWLSETIQPELFKK